MDVRASAWQGRVDGRRRLRYAGSGSRGWNRKEERLLVRIIDFHAHAFPDALAERALPALEAEGHVRAPLDGKISSLLKSMDRAGVEISVVASIATRPKQFDSILKWSREIAGSRLVPFPSVHPDDPQAVERIGVIAAEGFKGLKMHPYYQGYAIDEDRMMPLYERMAECGLILLCHTGFDMAYPRDRVADPARIRRALDRFPDLLFVTLNHA